MLLLSLAYYASAADTPIILPKSPAGYTLELDRLPLPAGTKLEGAQRDDEGILTIRLLAPDPAKNSKALTLPLRFAPESQVGDVPAAWSERGSAIAFILSCYESSKADERRLFVFCTRHGELRPVALPDLYTHLTTKRQDFAWLAIHYSGADCFGWVGDDLLIVQFNGSCALSRDVGDTESREISGYAVFQLADDGTIKIREILNLRVQG